MLEVKVTVTLAPEILSILQGLIGQAVKEGTPISKPDEVSEDSEVKLDDLLEIAKGLVQSEKRGKVKEMLSEYGVAGISKLKKEHYPDVYNKLNQIKEAA